VDGHVDASVWQDREVNRRHGRVDLGPPPGPVVADLVAAAEVAALPSIRPLDVVVILKRSASISRALNPRYAAASISRTLWSTSATGSSCPGMASSSWRLGPKQSRNRDEAGLVDQSRPARPPRGHGPVDASVSVLAPG
jgi:hypothetical protein